ncbi:hypothetical protein GCM10027452_30700 [Micromonospora halotolerans]
MAICSVSSPAACSRIVGQRDVVLTGVGIVRVVEDQVAAAIAVGDHAEPAAGFRHQIVTDADPR